MTRDEALAYFRAVGFDRDHIRVLGGGCFVSPEFLAATVDLHRGLLAAVQAHEATGEALGELRDQVKELVEQAGKLGDRG